MEIHILVYKQIHAQLHTHTNFSLSLSHSNTYTGGQLPDDTDISNLEISSEDFFATIVPPSTTVAFRALHKKAMFYYLGEYFVPDNYLLVFQFCFCVCVSLAVSVSVSSLSDDHIRSFFRSLPDSLPLIHACTFSTPCMRTHTSAYTYRGAQRKESQLAQGKRNIAGK